MASLSRKPGHLPAAMPDRNRRSSAGCAFAMSFAMCLGLTSCGREASDQPVADSASTQDADIQSDTLDADETPPFRVQWLIPGNTSSGFTVSDIVLDGSGNTYAVGVFAGSLTPPGDDPIAASGELSTFLLKRAPDGSHAWSREFLPPSAATAWARSIAISSDGILYVVGNMQWPISAPTINPFIVATKSDGAGDLWRKTFRTDFAPDPSDLSRGPTASTVAVMRSGDLVIAGTFSGSVQFNEAGSLTASSQSAYVARVQGSTGKILWLKSFGGPGGIVTASQVAVDAVDNVYLLGTLSGTATFGSSPLVSVDAMDSYLASVDATGSHRWATSIAAAQASSDAQESLVYDQAGDRLVLATSFADKITVNAVSISAVGGRDVLLATFGTDGRALGAMGLGTSADDGVARVIADGDGNLLVAGSTWRSPAGSSGPRPHSLIARVATPLAMAWLWIAPTEEPSWPTSLSQSPTDRHVAALGGTFATHLDLGSAAIDSSSTEDIFLGNIILDR
jgi:hypothetical protein